MRVSCPGPVGRLFGWDIVEGSVRFDAGGRPADETKIRKQSCAELDALAEGRRERGLAASMPAATACAEPSACACRLGPARSRTGRLGQPSRPRQAPPRTATRRAGAERPATLTAVDVLAHESWHLQGVMDEAVTECRSLQTMSWTAQQLGASAEQGHAMALAQYEGAYRRMSEPYRSGGCVDGGPLDLRPDDERFP